MNLYECCDILKHVYWLAVIHGFCVIEVCIALSSYYILSGSLLFNFFLASSKNYPMAWAQPFFPRHLTSRTKSALHSRLSSSFPPVLTILLLGYSLYILWNSIHISFLYESYALCKKNRQWTEITQSINVTVWIYFIIFYFILLRNTPKNSVRYWSHIVYSFDTIGNSIKLPLDPTSRRHKKWV